MEAPDPRLQSRLRPWAERLLEASDPDRTLLQAALALGAEAAAIWRRLDDGRPWPVLERGPSDLLPTRDEVCAVWDGRLEIALPHRRHVLARPRVALAVGGLGDDRDDDLLEALLVLADTLADDGFDDLPGLHST